jgi:anthranilate synthase component 1
VELDADLHTPISLFLRLAHGESHAFLFESVEGGERVGRYSFFGAGPRRVRSFTLGEGGDPLAELEQDLARHRASVVPEGTPRFAGGWVGWLGYDAVRLIEPSVPATARATHGFADALFMDFDTIVAFDNLHHGCSVIAEVRVEEARSADRAFDEALARIRRTIRKLETEAPTRRNRRGSGSPTLKPEQSRSSFEKAVQKARAHIAAGDCQQIVLSQRFTAEVSVDPFEVYRALRKVNPSPYLFFVRAGTQALIGSSPETLVRLEDGEITLRPLAGTRRRGATPAEDLRLEQDLRADPKERAEHVMLVDLGRNDVGRVAQVGSVRVEELMGVERYSHVMHLVSQVRGRLAAGKSALDVLRATFPAGTVSGAPKVRAMQIIDALEPVRRGPYAGCVGYLDRRGNLEMAIAIRTLMQSGKRLVAQSGAGVVHDSVPRAEYEETLNKARALFVAVKRATARPAPRSKP